MSKSNKDRFKNEKDKSDRSVKNEKDKSVKNEKDKSDKVDKVVKTEKDKSDKVDKVVKNEKIDHEYIEHSYMFVYQKANKFYSNLKSITDMKDGEKIMIHPVYFNGYEGSMLSEKIIYDSSINKYKAKDKDHTWLDVVYGDVYDLYLLEISKIIEYDGGYFHCEGCLLGYFLNGEIKDINIEDVK